MDGEAGRLRQPRRDVRRTAALERAGGRCVWCGRLLRGLVPATTDHLVPRLKGGPSWPENELSACRRCNAERGHQAPADWLGECERRGWTPDVGQVLDALVLLDAAIARRGGQRRARPYLAGQLRRLRRMVA